MNRRLAILGASGHGKVVADIAEQSGWERIDFFDDSWPAVLDNGTWQVVGDMNVLCETVEKYTGVIVAIGNNLIRTQKLTFLVDGGAPIVSLFHPSSVVCDSSKIGAGSVVMAGAVVNIDSQIGAGAILNTGCSVDHDCTLGDFVHVSPGARLAGSVSVGDCSWIGIGAVVRQGIVIGDNVTVGAGAAVVSDLPDAVTAVGVPAKVDKKLGGL